MGLFSNLFGNSGKDLDNALNQMKNLADDILDDGQINNQPNQSSAPAFNAEPLRESEQMDSSFIEEGESGDSWGPTMPSEPNQFNSGLKYQDYFTSVFNEAFSAYQIDKQDVRNYSAAVFTFSQAGSKKLVVEVISERSNPYKVRNDCRAQGIPYLRYYYDYNRWWNTKSYVTRRTSKALGIG